VPLVAFPFDVAADGVGDRDAGIFAGEQIIEGVAEFVGGLFAGVAGVVVHSAGVAELAIGVEDVEVRRAECAVGECDLLRLIAEVGEAEILFLRPLDHVLERIAGVPFGFVGVDSGHGHVFGRIIGEEFVHAVFAADDERAVIAGEDDDEELGIFEAGERIVFAIDAGEIEVGGFLVEGEGEGHKDSFESGVLKLTYKTR